MGKIIHNRININNNAKNSIMQRKIKMRTFFVNVRVFSHNNDINDLSLI